MFLSGSMIRRLNPTESVARSRQCCKIFKLPYSFNMLIALELLIVKWNSFPSMDGLAVEVKKLNIP